MNPPTHEPTRLKDDARFIAAAGICFEHEAETLPQHDMAALRARLDAGLQAGVTTALPEPGALGAMGAKLAVVAGTTVVVAGLMAWGMGAGGPAEQGLAPGAEAPVEVAAPVEEAAVEEAQAVEEVAVAEAAEVPVVEVLPAAVEVEEAAAAEAEAEVGDAEVAPVERAATGSNPTPAPRAEASRGRAVAVPVVVEAADEAPAEEAAEPVEAVAEAAPAEIEAPASTLAAQLALYERGRESLRGGALAAAVSAFEEYGRRFPAGELATEARLSLLEALVRSGQAARAERLAGRLLAGGGPGSRRGELLRVRGEQLVKLGRCEDAAAVLEQARGAGAISAAEAQAAVAACGAKP